MSGHCEVTRSDMIPTTNMNTLHCVQPGVNTTLASHQIFIFPTLTSLTSLSKVYEKKVGWMVVMMSDDCSGVL